MTVADAPVLRMNDKGGEPFTPVGRTTRVVRQHGFLLKNHRAAIASGDRHQERGHEDASVPKEIVLFVSSCFRGCI
jgi:hypothetical protein